MSRARVHEVSSPISLFPFIGILLCTMGALLVVLVAVSRSARDSAQRNVDAKRAAAAPRDATLQKKMDYVQTYRGSLDKIRGEAETKLRNEHARLSHVEDHIRRLHDRIRSLEIAATELDALEKEHYDDREQAERETVRLKQLIEESQNTIAALQASANDAPGSYAVVPYEGPNGTYRRPMYIECVKEGVILQPEGIRIAASDLLPPYGAGNPLAAVLRASRDHLVRLNPQEGQRRDLEPYPLLLVRSEGLLTYDRARQAIEAGDFDLGFELVEDDWKLKFPHPDPQLATLQQETLEVARRRQAVLAAAAPRAYRGGMISVQNRYGLDDEVSEGDDRREGSVADYGGSGSGAPEFGSDAGAANADGGQSSGSGGFPGYGSSALVASSGGDGGHGGEGTTAIGSPNDTAAGAIGLPNSPAGPDSSANNAVTSSAWGDQGTSRAPSGASAAYGGGTTSGSGGGFDGGGSPALMANASDPNAPPDSTRSQSVTLMYGAMPPEAAQTLADSKRGNNQPCPADSRGKDWALKQKPQRATPVRRTIRIVVREDHIGILPDSTTDPKAVSVSKVVPFRGDTVESLDDFVKQVRDHIDSWGIAGNGLYWRPVIVLSVAPQGQRRAEDLQRLLRNSGLELRIDDMATNAPPRNLQ